MTDDCPICQAADTLTHIPVSDGAMSPVVKCRTLHQRIAVAQIVSHPEFAAACGNPFTEEVSKKYRKQFAFLFYTKAGRLCCATIRPKGNVSAFYADDGSMATAFERERA